nr:reverse transcriptase domain-containing protein [Tanacetum cinerariifolium]
MPGPEEPEQAPPLPDYVPSLEHVDDEIVAEDQPYAEDASPIAQLPKYILESDFEMHPEDDDDKDPEEDPVDYPADGGDDGDDEEESSEDDEDEEGDEMDVEEDEEDDEMDIPFPPLPPILSPPSPVVSPAPPPSPIRSLGYRAAMIRLRDEAASTSHSSPLQLPSARRKEDRPEITLPPQKRLDIALGPIYDVGESSSAAAARPAGGFREDYGFVATGAPVSTDTELGGYVKEFETRVRHDMYEIYTRLDDEQTERQLLAASNEELKEPMEDQPLPADASPTNLSPGYSKDEKDPKEDPADYPADRGNNDDDESSNDDDDDDVEKDEEDKEEEEHLTLADPSDVSTDDLVPSS